MTAHSDIAGVILAGGGGRRMFPASSSGGEKALVPLGGRAMIEHVVATIAPQVSLLVINTNGAHERLMPLGHPIVADRFPDQGPLAGLLAAMDWIIEAGRPHDAVLSVSTDTPFLPGDLVLRLAVALPRRPAIARSEGRVHPVIGLWPVSLRENLSEALRQGQRSVEKFALRHDAIEVDFPLRTIGIRTVDPFFNANTPEELALAEAIMAGI